MKREKKIVLACLFLLSFISMFWYRIRSDGEKQKIVIAVLDTGYTGEHPRVLATGRNTIEGNGDVLDFHGHGTNITELILEQTDERVFILPVKIADNYGQATIESAGSGIVYALEQGADIINFSLTMESLNGIREVTEIMESAADSGVTVVTAAGNYGNKTDGVFPANEESAVVVSAVDADNVFCDYSNYGKTIDFAAYGYYKGDRGTSYAAARVSALFANELVTGKDAEKNAEEVLRERAADKGRLGRDDYYGYGVLTTKETEKEIVKEEVYQKKSANDLGCEIRNLDWKSVDGEKLNKYFNETNRAYVGMFLSQLEEEEVAELKEKADILKSAVLVQKFCINEKGSYEETAHREEGFLENAVKAYLAYKKKLTVAAEFLILQKNTGEFAISSANRETIYYYQISGFSYRTDTPDSAYFQMFDPETLTVTRTVVKQNNPEFTAPYVAEMNKYLRGASSFAASYINPETGQYVEEKNFRAIAHEADTGRSLYGLSVTLGGYSVGRAGYHTSDEDIIQIPYNFSHVYPQYAYADYPEPLTYYFGRETGVGQVEWMPEPQRVSVQPKSFKRLLKTNYYYIYYHGAYKQGYDYTNMDYSLSLKQMLEKYIQPGYQEKRINGVNILTSENSVSESSFTVNFDLHSSMAIQWNNGETVTKVIKNDIPEYNFPLVPNTYTIKYHGNGASDGSMADTHMTYDTAKNLEANRYSRVGYQFKGWAVSPNGFAVYKDAQTVNNLTAVHNAVVNLYAVWKPVGYTIRFEGNGATDGMMPDIAAVYEIPALLPVNRFIRNKEYGQSVFRGWSTDAAASEPTYKDGAAVKNLTEEPDGTVTLYAVWDDCPWIVAEDLYYTLKEAQSGRITYEELMSHALAKDREAGGIVRPGIDAEKGTSFGLIDYAETDFTQFMHEGSVTETYKVVDSIGNAYKKMITVFVIDTAPEYIKPDGTTRFISEKYYYKPYESGGLKDHSVWKTDSEYVRVIKQAFENGRKNTPAARFYFTHEEVLAMKEFIRVNGIGSFRNTDILQQFYGKFMTTK